jgi:predicted lysophospholipase L1 biosynthesis ABC-type transport system permease subunit
VEGGDGIGEGGLVTADTLQSLDPEAALSVATIAVRPGADREATRNRISEALGFAIGPLDVPGVIQNLDRVRSSPYVVAAILVLLALLSLANLIFVALRHRAREIAVLRAAGADRRWVGRVAHWHAVAFTVVVVALAAPFGVVLGRLVFRVAIAERIGVAADTFVPVAALLGVLVVMVVVADVVGQVTVRRGRVSVARQLTTE